MNTNCTLNGESVACPEFLNNISGPFLGTLLAICFVLILFTITIPLWKIHVKAGKPGWASIVPIYNIVVLVQIAKKPVWYIFLMFIPIVNIFVAFILIQELARNFNKGIGFTIGMILLPFIFYPILGYGKAEYVKDEIMPISPSPTPVN